MINHFTFHPVGQGLFYSGCLNHGEYTFVYDCGVKPKNSYLQNEINQFAKYHKTVDFVLLSHLHEDHFSGIIDLCLQCHVKKLYLPYLGHDHNVIALILANTLLTGDPSPASFNVFYTVSSLYGLTGVEGNSQLFRGTEVEYWGREDDDSERDKTGYIYQSQNFSYLVDGKPYWEFKMLNRARGAGLLRKLSTLVSSLLASYSKTLNYSVSILDLVRMGNIATIKSIYEQVFGKAKQNLISSLLIHYPTKTGAQSSIKCCKACCTKHRRLCNRSCYCTTTVLTGDVEFDKHLSDKVNKAISALPHCVLQIPHHGSLPNWKTIDISLLIHSDVFVISHGHNHKYHPNGSALLQMQSYLCSNNVCSVTQYQDYKYVIWA